MRTYSTLIVDDEQQARKGLQALLKLDESIHLVASCANGMDAIEQINQLQPQLILLDIQMPEINGFDVLNSIPYEKMPQVIFTTAYDQYALRAFEVHAVDYLLKPFTDERFFEAVNLAKSRIRQANLFAERQNLHSLLEKYALDEQQDKRGRFIQSSLDNKATDRITIKCDGKIHFVSTSDIRYISAEDYYIQIHLIGRQLLVRDSLKAIEQRLPEHEFTRIHRSTLVNLKYVQSITPHQNGDFYVDICDGNSLRGSRNYRSIFEQIDGKLNK